MTKRNLAPAAGSALDPRDRKFLTEIYKDDVLGLSQLLNRDLSHWRR